MSERKKGWVRERGREREGKGREGKGREGKAKRVNCERKSLLCEEQRGREGDHKHKHTNPLADTAYTRNQEKNEDRG